MPGMSMPMTVEMEDGEKHRVVVDQRDISEWEQQPFGCSFKVADSEKLVTFMRWTAWHALRRTGVIDRKLGWATFQNTCVEVTDVVDEEEVERGVADPTTADTSATT